MSFSTIHVIAEAGSSIGYGHLMRTASLAHNLKLKNNADIVYCSSAGSDLSSISEYCDKIILTDDKREWETIPPGSLVIVDGYDKGAKLLTTLGERNIFRIAYDDAGIRGVNPCEVLVCGMPGEKAGRYTTPEGCVRCIGHEYASIRKDILSLREAGNIDTGNGTILITMGGSDPGDVTATCVEALSAGNYPLSVVLGPGYKGKAEEFAGSGNISFYRNPVNFPEMMAACTLALSAAGGTSLELACLGKPMALISLGKDQLDSAVTLHDRHAAKHLGYFANISGEKIRSEIFDLMNDPARLIEMGERAASFVDGKGPARLADIVLREFTNWSL
ncbi:PseG/SpsG family protein [Desulfovibrio sp. JC010]|uniref:PseG/SpsG family protein n=1 Tax=Desulfovibrio sp. JC010 TaxID=2593641 RepID=UPI0013D47FA7|nr:glycosyltransferase [Desulfovibrio sp. JC010]NDV26707.1 hypothetical protein [Desulfovibrio sp. JC010]